MEGGWGEGEEIADIYNRDVYLVHYMFIFVSSAVPSEWEERWNGKTSQN